MKFECFSSAINHCFFFCCCSFTFYMAGFSYLLCAIAYIWATFILFYFSANSSRFQNYTIGIFICFKRFAHYFKLTADRIKYVQFFTIFTLLTMKKWQGIVVVVVVVVVEPSAITDMFWNNRANGIFTMKMYIHSFYFQPFIVRIPIFLSISKCSNDVSIIPRKPRNLIMFHRFAFLSVDTRSKLAGIFCIDDRPERFFQIIPIIHFQYDQISFEILVLCIKFHKSNRCPGNNVRANVHFN